MNKIFLMVVFFGHFPTSKIISLKSHQKKSQEMTYPDSKKSRDDPPLTQKSQEKHTRLTFQERSFALSPFDQDIYAHITAIKKVKK